jgi:apolipoprotein N-acyltransferase
MRKTFAERGAAPPALMRRLAHAVMLASGWQRAALACAAGGLSTLALAPVDAWPLLFLTFPILLWLIDGAADGRLRGLGAAAAVGWWFGFGYFATGLYWTGNALLVDAGTFGWLLPFAVLGLPAGLALFTAAGTALARLLWTRGAARVLALAVGLTLAEWLRGHVLTGFPWNAFGYALTGPLVLAQGVALIGLWGLTFVAVAVFASPAVLIDERSDSRRPWLPVALALAALATLATYGAVRLATTPTSFVDNVRLRIMQPNLPQDAKFNYAGRAQVMRHYLTLSDRATGPARQGVRDVTHLIWPESAFPFFLTREPEALAQIAALLPPGTVLITGAARPEETTARPARAYNSIYVIDHEGSILALYDKVHLVPFGEYLPLQGVLESIGLQQLTKMQGGFIAGRDRRPLKLPGAPAALPLICYEIIFPGEAVPRAGERPGWLVNLTNDGWFGRSTGPYQHLQQARVRAIEEGLPLVRAANTGISAVIDPLGRTLASLPLGAEGVLDSALPRPEPPPPFVRSGDAPAGVFLVIAVAVLAGQRWRQRARKALAEAKYPDSCNNRISDTRDRI